MRVGLELFYDNRVMLWRPLDHGPLVVGHNPECDLCVPDEALSPVQCVIRRDGDLLTLVNRHPGGTRVGDQVVEETLTLAEGDTIQLGPVTAHVRFVHGDSPPAGRTRTLAEGTPVREPGLALTVPEVYPGERWLLGEVDLTVGSDPSNDVTIDDPFVSGFHARFSIDEGRCTVCDLGSRNGVFIGEQKIREGEVPPGSQVRLGRTVLVVSSMATEQSSPPASSGGLPHRLVGTSPAISRVRDLARRVARADAPVLITGETGSGKEVVARLVAELSPRAARPFVALNCGSLSRNLIESELFGHERGAFTGAVSRKSGAFEVADSGTLFLDEVGELPLELQPQLLRVLETGEVRRVGSTESFYVDVRVIAATNRQLQQEVAAGAFREDLFHRLHVLSIELPSLVARRDDIPELAEHFLASFAPVAHRVEIDSDALDVLRQHDWPGNVRELRNVIQRAVLLRRGDRIEAADITFTPSTLASRVQTLGATSGRTLQDLERHAIATELRRFHGNKKEAAAALGISRSTIHRKIDEYDIDVDSLS